MGSLVGVSQTVLATIVQIDPMWVNFNNSEKAVLRLWTVMRKRGIAASQLHGVPIEMHKVRYSWNAMMPRSDRWKVDQCCCRTAPDPA